MDTLIGTRLGLFDLSGRSVSERTQINHVARQGDGWWAVDTESRIWHDGDLMATAEAVLNCIEPTPDSVWVGADLARLFNLAGDRLTEDEFFAEAPDRDSWHTPWGGPPDVRSLAFGPDGVLYVNVHVGGILRYDDSGIFPTLDIGADVHQVVADHRRGGIVVAATARGLAQSSDGRDFSFRSDGLAHRYCRAVALQGDVVILSASRGPRGGDSHVYRASLGDGGLTLCQGGLPDDFDNNVNTHCLLAREEMFFLGHGDTVWLSTDGAVTWEAVATDLPPITCLA